MQDTRAFERWLRAQWIGQAKRAIRCMGKKKRAKFEEARLQRREWYRARKERPPLLPSWI